MNILRTISLYTLSLCFAFTCLADSQEAKFTIRSYSEIESVDEVYPALKNAWFYNFEGSAETLFLSYSLTSITDRDDDGEYEALSYFDYSETLDDSYTDADGSLILEFEEYNAEFDTTVVGFIRRPSSGWTPSEEKGFFDKTVGTLSSNENIANIGDGVNNIRSAVIEMTTEAGLQYEQSVNIYSNVDETVIYNQYSVDTDGFIEPSAMLVKATTVLPYDYLGFYPALLETKNTSSFSRLKLDFTSLSEDLLESGDYVGLDTDDFIHLNYLMIFEDAEEIDGMSELYSQADFDEDGIYDIFDFDQVFQSSYLPIYASFESPSNPGVYWIDALSSWAATDLEIEPYYYSYDYAWIWIYEEGDSGDEFWFWSFIMDSWVYASNNSEGWEFSNDFGWIYVSQLSGDVQGLWFSVLTTDGPELLYVSESNPSELYIPSEDGVWSFLYRDDDQLVFEDENNEERVLQIVL